MESPAKKRSLFGGFSLFGRSTAEPTESTPKIDTTRKLDSSLGSSVARAVSTDSPESPVKRATESQLSSRKLIDRPQGPSSKLSQTFSAKDFTQLSSNTPKATNFSNASATTPRRMPGDKPVKSTGFSSSAYGATTFSGAATTPRNLFRTSAMSQRPALQSFSPRVPALSVKPAFAPHTPSKATRGITVEISGRSLPNTTSAELFKMRIPSPPRHLTGEVLAKEVPENQSRPGSIYADEFLAHYCPPDFDDLQRRQFFCVLDLRRLKYAADEIFTKKDWKINILNFSKEYEKSRSLIMLRYGLYEFKTVRASEAVTKEWKQKHGIASSEDEKDESPAAVVHKPAVGGKRKAEDQLTPKDTALTVSSSNVNKRARGTAGQVAQEQSVSISNKSKRKADAVGAPDENQPSKLQKPASAPPKVAQSATRSVFEKIANEAQNGTGLRSTPTTKPTPKDSTSSLFGNATKGLNGTVGRSVFDAESLKPPANNIFGHLSDNSKGSGNDDADGESEDASDSDAAADAESEAPEASLSDEPSVAISGGVATPQFGLLHEKKAAVTNGTSSASSETGDSSKSKSLFDRINTDANGQPVRVLAEDKPKQQNTLGSRAASPFKDVTATPTNNTWTANTPIKFAGESSQPSSIFAASAAKPASSASSLFGAVASQSETNTATTGAAVAKPTNAAFSLFAAAAKPDANATTPAPALAPAQEAAKPTAGSIFGKAPSTEPLEAAAKATDAGSKLFGSSSLFGQAKAVDEQKSPSVSTLFGAKPAEAGIAPAAATQPATSLFGAKPSDAGIAPPTATQPTTSLFGNLSAAPASSSSIFSSTPSQPASNLFGAASKPTEVPNGSAEPAAKKPMFGATTTQATSSIFGLSTPKPAATTESPADSTASKPLFGIGAKPATETASLFGATISAQPNSAQESKPLFGNGTAQTEAANAPAMNIFGNSTAASVPPQTSNIFSFGASQNATPAVDNTASSQATPAQPSAPIFGGGSSSFTFQAGLSAVNNPFASNGSSSAPPSFTFGSNSGSTPSNSGSSAFVFGGGSGASNPTNDAGGSQSGNMFGGAPTNGASSGMFTFGGAGTQPTPSSLFPAQKPGGIFGLAPGAGTSTGTNSPFTLGGASSLATTPATGTPEPGAENDDAQVTNTDGDEAPQEQISLTEGGPGEEDESVVHEVRAKAVKLVPNSGNDSDDEAKKAKKSPWVVQGVGPLRVLKHKTTGAIRMLLRADPGGNIALNRMVLPDFSYKPDPAGSKYIKITTSNETASGLETWMLQVKTPAAAQALADVLEANKSGNKK